MAAASPIRHFISWAHQDGARQEKLGHPLAVLWREGVILAKPPLNWRNGDGARCRAERDRPFAPSLREVFAEVGIDSSARLAS
jgi:hypothetical protein